MKSYEGLFQQLESVMQESWMQDLLDEADRPNFWSIVEYGRNSYEIRYSRMLRWLLDPHGNHGLGRLFARELAQLVASKRDPEWVELLDSLTELRNDATEKANGDEALTEALTKRNKNGGVDVLYFEPGFGAEGSEAPSGLCIAIENKVGAGESFKNGVSQLETYFDAVEGSAYGGSKFRLYVYLTLAEDPPEEPSGHAKYYEAYQLITYEGLVRVLIQMRDSLGVDSDAEHARKIVQDFIFDVQRQYRLKQEQKPVEEFDKYRKEIGVILSGLGLLPSGGAVDDEQAAAADTTSVGNKQLSAFKSRFENDLEHASRALKIIHDGIRIGKQDHRPNRVSQKFIRTIFNRIVENDHFDLSVPELFGKERKEFRTADVVNADFKKHGISRVRLKQGKGQGIDLYFGDSGAGIYFSADASANFPNHGCMYFLETEVKDDPVFPKEFNGKRLIQAGSQNLTGATVDEDLGPRADKFINCLLKKLDDDPDLKAIAGVLEAPTTRSH